MSLVLFHMIVHCVLVLLNLRTNCTDKLARRILLVCIRHLYWLEGYRPLQFLLNQYRMEVVDAYVNGVRKVASMIVKSNTTSGFQSGSRLGSKIVSFTQETSTKTQELPDESFLSALVTLFIVWQIVFALGGALQSYMYNQSIDTHPFIAFLYIVLCFLFPYFYYPYYTFFLSGREGGNGRQNNKMMGGSKK